jgi:hypothetical protein
LVLGRLAQVQRIWNPFNTTGVGRIPQVVGGRDKPGHDEEKAVRSANRRVRGQTFRLFALAL